MNMFKCATFSFLALIATIAGAETAQETSIKKIIEPRLGENVKVDSVTKTPYSGLFEVRTGGDIIYTDEKARYLFVGRVIDTQTQKDITKERIDEITKIKFSDLPLESAIKMVKGNGKRVIAIFEDPNCGYCKRLRQTLNEMDNVTVYSFLYNILSEDSAIKSQNIWCAPDRNKALDDWMLNGKAAPTAMTGCTNPNEKVFELGRKLKVTGTPAIFFADGTRIPGALDAKALEAKFASIK
ncbi:MAG: DsbC family protein [Pseudomonadota bacterium]